MKPSGMIITYNLSAWGLPALFIRVPAGPVTRVVVGVDDSAGWAAALRWAVGEAWRHRAALRIVSAWEKPRETSLPLGGDPARIAAARVEKALDQVRLQRHRPYRITCATTQGSPGEVLLREAGDTGLLVLGTTGNNVPEAIGPTGRYCLRHGRGPLVLVPARSGT
jgi:nucleotide-binding universal stress UspA family protein